MNKPLSVLTSVKTVFNGSHIDPDSGLLHGHDYEVVATWKNTDARFEALKVTLNAVLAPIDHQRLPDFIWSAEDLGRWIFRQLDCCEVQVNRPSIGHSVTVNRS